MPVVIVGLGIFVRFLVAFALRWLWIITVGAVLGWLASRLISVSILNRHPLAGVGRALRGVNRDIENTLDRATLASEGAATALFLAVGHQLERAGFELAGFAVAVAQAVAGVAIEVPKIAGKAAKAAASAASVALIAKHVRALTVAVQHVGKRVGRLEHAFAERLRTLARGIDRVAGRTIPAIRARIGRAEARVGRLERRVTSQSFWKTRIRAIAGTAFFAAAVGAALARLGLGWLRCSNVKRAGKAVCGMNSGLLSELLLDVAVLGIAFNLEEFARDVQSVTDVSVDLIRRAVD